MICKRKEELGNDYRTQYAGMRTVTQNTKYHSCGRCRQEGFSWLHRAKKAEWRLIAIMTRWIFEPMSLTKLRVPFWSPPLGRPNPFHTAVVMSWLSLTNLPPLSVRLRGPEPAKRKNHQTIIHAHAKLPPSYHDNSVGLKTTGTNSSPPWPIIHLRELSWYFRYIVAHPQRTRICRSLTIIWALKD
jgi:hypothetical protein